MHDIGNVVNRHDHAISGATMAFRILDNMGMDPSDVAAVITLSAITMTLPHFRSMPLPLP